MIVKEEAFDTGDLAAAITKGYMALDTYLLRCNHTLLISSDVCL